VLLEVVLVALMTQVWVVVLVGGVEVVTVGVALVLRVAVKSVGSDGDIHLKWQ